MNGLSPIVREALESLNLWLKLKNKRLYYDIRKESLEKQDKLKHEIEVLRSEGRISDHVRADILRKELAAERAELEHLSAAYSEAAGREDDSDS